MKTVYILKRDDTPEVLTDTSPLSIMIIHDEHDQTVFELENQERIICKGDSLAGALMKFSELQE